MKTLSIIFFTLTICVSAYAQINFQEHIYIENSTSVGGGDTMNTTDVDGDGDIDLLLAFSNSIAWFENTDGQGSYGELRTINEDETFVQSISGNDIDGDGDMDILVASWFGNTITWYENLDGLGNFGSQQIITTNTEGWTSALGVDIDGDADIDVLTSSFDGLLIWFENLDGQGNFGPQQIIYANPNGYEFSISFGDLDGDGDMDVVSGSEDEISWHENINGLGDFNSPEVINAFPADGRIVLYVEDIDGDGDLDVISGTYYGENILWYENINGQGNFGSQHLVATGQYLLVSIKAIDLDGDNDMDLISAGDTVSWHENVDGLGSFEFNQLLTSADGNAALAADVDLDGDIDILSTRRTIYWFKNIDGQGYFGNQLNISTGNNQGKSVYAGDIDGDGDLDLIMATHGISGNISWSENLDGLGDFGVQRVISNEVGDATSVIATDIDGDGDLDVLSASTLNDKIAWYENLNGLGNFGQQQIIINTGNPQQLYPIDLDNDGDMDVLSGSSSSNLIIWHENLDGLGNFENHIITNEADGVNSVFAADLDGDGDADILSASWDDDKIAWYENTDGLGSFGPQQLITTSVDFPQLVYASDLDGDGDMDVLSASEGDDKVAWYENMDGLGNFGGQNIISSADNHANSVFAVDVDGDGDMDVVSTALFDDSIAWYENIDGLGDFGQQQIITENVDFIQQAFAADINGDGYIDILSASVNDGKIAWFENSGVLAINENPLVEFTFYPNPTEDVLKIESKISIVQIEIYSLLGQLILSNSNQNNIDVSNLSQGLYFIKIKDENGDLGIKKVVKK